MGRKRTNEEQLELPLSVDDRIAVRPKRAAQLLDISLSQLYLEMGAKRLPYAKHGTIRLIPVDGLRTWLRSRMSV